MTQKSVKYLKGILIIDVCYLTYETCVRLPILDVEAVQIQVPLWQPAAQN